MRTTPPSAADSPDEWARLYRPPRLDGLELVHARYIRHRFARHAHGEFVVGTIATGVQSFWYRGARRTTPAGRVFLINPGEAHTGEAPSPDGYVYRTLYPSTGLVARVAAQIGGRGRGVPSFPEPVIDDPILARQIARLHRAVAAGGSALEYETWLVAALARLIAWHAEERPAIRSVSVERAAVRRAREYLDAHCAENVSLTELAAVASLSPYHLARAFRADVGLPPHAYLEARRIERARELLALGRPLSRIAYELGYPDQSHFTRRFKRFVGLTPGAYAQARKMAQDGPAAGR